MIVIHFFFFFFITAQPRLSRAEERRHSLALPSMRTVVRKHLALKMIPTQLEDHGGFHIVSIVSYTLTANAWFYFLFISMLTFVSDLNIHAFIWLLVLCNLQECSCCDVTWGLLFNLMIISILKVVRTSFWIIIWLFKGWYRQRFVSSSTFLEMQCKTSWTMTHLYVTFPPTFVRVTYWLLPNPATIEQTAPVSPVNHRWWYLTMLYQHSAAFLFI